MRSVRLCISRALKARTSGGLLELKDQLAQTVATSVMSILTRPREHRDAGAATEPPLRQIIDGLQQVMCTHDAEKLAISVLEMCLLANFLAKRATLTA